MVYGVRMGMTTKAAIEIAAPREEVFRWITDHDRLVTWMGSAGSMPQDPSSLKVGFTAEAPGPSGTQTLTVTAWDPPSAFGCTISYPGGDSIALYTLTATTTGTRLELSGDTDWGQLNDSGLEKALEGQSEEAKRAVHDQLAVLEQKLLDGEWDTSTRAMMQKSLEQSLEKLKSLVEAG